MTETKFTRIAFCLLQFFICILALIVPYYEFLVFYTNLTVLFYVIAVTVLYLYYEFCIGQYYLYYKDRDKYYEQMKRKAYDTINTVLKDKSTVSDLHEPSKPF